ncbi:MAG TPA: TetR/AcrR family transcriptional regulator [Ornithinimicrobium sp.]|uniref:TetR/AcrR family transcriptional regulator n=1 Tax=Ornithinimicrobium sp. TaxID=1977084 RepID=UPI002B4918F2|nr:TetR/AcrR family transcriptional regulator [Ornithinimicrobium sp.]HKJ12260.1 TetR/AcrR family transcriptional regulator [Ornithinimicrobium sp.]
MSSEALVVASLDYIDTYGVDQLTMRRLGAALGVEAMSIYRYTPGREQLVEAVVAYVLREVAIEMTGRHWPTWQHYVRHLAHAVRRTAMQHPALFRHMASAHRQSAWLRSPLCDLGLVEGLLSTLHRAGLSDVESVKVYRALTAFLLGHLLLETAERAPGSAQTGLAGVQAPTLSPVIQRLREDVVDREDQIQFDRELGALMQRLDDVSAPAYSSGRHGTAPPTTWEGQA